MHDGPARNQEAVGVSHIRQQFGDMVRVCTVIRFGHVRESTGQRSIVDESLSYCGDLLVQVKGAGAQA